MLYFQPGTSYFSFSRLSARAGGRSWRAREIPRHRLADALVAADGVSQMYSTFPPTRRQLPLRCGQCRNRDAHRALNSIWSREHKPRIYRLTKMKNIVGIRCLQPRLDTLRRAGTARPTINTSASLRLCARTSLSLNSYTIHDRLCTNETNQLAQPFHRP